jgi:hypothetical protein
VRFVRTIAVCGFLTAVSLLTAAPVRADAQADAKDLFARGKELRQAGDCNAAAALFRKAYQVYPNGLGSLRNLAECEEAIGHYASARRAWLDLKRGVNLQPNEPKYEGWDKDALEAAARLKPKVALVTVDIIVKSPEGEGPANEKSGVDLFVNGEKVAPNLIGTELDRDPGTYVFRAQVPDAEPVEQKLSLNAGDIRQIKMRLVRTPKPVGPTPEEIERMETARSRRTMGWAAIGVGGVSLAVSAATFYLRSVALDDLKEACPGRHETGPCPTASQDAIDRGSTMSVLSPIFLAVGVVGVGAGIALFATAPSSSPRTGRGLDVYAGPGRVDAVWRF